MDYHRFLDQFSRFNQRCQPHMDSVVCSIFFETVSKKAWLPCLLLLQQDKSPIPATSPKQSHDGRVLKDTSTQPLAGSLAHPSLSPHTLTHPSFSQRQKLLFLLPWLDLHFLCSLLPPPTAIMIRDKRNLLEGLS